jgi:NAD(P)-dependent dehydrogenase (short-subunit alcohol dehydrogenase family)
MTFSLELQGRRALVTGGTKGIGERLTIAVERGYASLSD